MSRLLLVRHGETSATETRTFPTDEPLTRAGREAARALTGTLPAADTVLSSPAARCRQTAAAAGLVAQIDPRLAECDFGSWAGRSLVQVNTEDPDGVRLWMLDPSSRPHGGESVNDLSARVAAWLAEARRGTTVALTHRGFISAAVAHVRGLPPAAIWECSVQPLAVTELRRAGGRWRLPHSTRFARP